MTHFSHPYAPRERYVPPPPPPPEEMSDEERAVLEAQRQLEEDAPDLWRAGSLRWKLDDHQAEVYDLFHEWHARKQTEEYALEQEQCEESYDDVFFELIARRFGKTSKWIVMLCELALRLPQMFPRACGTGAVLTYATALQKDIGDLIKPLADLLTEDAPKDCKPVYYGSHLGSHEGLYFPKNGPARGSVIKLVGIDKHPDALRGRFSDGIVISEARDVRALVSTMQSVLLPQFQRRPWAFLAIETSAPDDIGHDLMRIVKPDAYRRRAYVERTIDANTVIDPREKAKAIRMAGGMGSVACEREYYNRIKRDENVVVVPEFDAPTDERPITKHVNERAVPEFAHCYVAMDPGVRDLCAILWAVWDWEAAVLYVQADWAKSNARIGEIAQVIKERETKLWGVDHEWSARQAIRDEHPALKLQAKTAKIPDGLHYWSATHKRLEQNPFRRVSDIEPRLLNELQTEHGIIVSNADKTMGARRELALQESAISGVRGAFDGEQIVIDPSCKTLIAHLTSARWNASRMDYERTDHFGHYDLLDCLVYLWRAVSANRKANPLPPIAFGKERDETFIRKELEERQPGQPSNRGTLAQVVTSGGGRWKPGSKRRWGRQ